MDIEKRVEKLSLVNQSTTDEVIANYDQEMKALWLQHHEPDIKEPEIKSWRSWEVGKAQVEEASS